MNEKRVKRFRRYLRSKGIDPTDPLYNAWSPSVYEAIMKVGDDEMEYQDGWLKVKKGVPCEMLECGRNLYKEMKGLQNDLQKT